MYKIYILVLVTFLIIFGANAQPETTDFPVDFEKMKVDTAKNEQSKFMIGGKNFIYMYIQLGLILGKPEGNGSDILYGNSSNFALGFRYFRRINKFYRMGFDIGHDGNSFSLKQDSSKILPNNILHKTERINLNNLNISFINRFSFGKTKNRMGAFFDLGGYAGWTHTSINYTLDKHQIANAANASKTQVYNRALVFVNDYQYGLMAGLGKNHFKIYAKYRLSNNFKSQFIYAELPRIVIGLEFALHQ
jgi:hypothetical protein